MPFYMFITGSTFASEQATHDSARNSTGFNPKGKTLKPIIEHSVCDVARLLMVQQEISRSEEFHFGDSGCVLLAYIQIETQKRLDLNLNLESKLDLDLHLNLKNN